MIPAVKQFSQLKIKVIPNAKQTQLAGWHGDFIKVKINAVPDKGKANDELVRFLCKQFNISKEDIEIIRGHKNHRKVLLLPRKKIAEIKNYI